MVSSPQAYPIGTPRRLALLAVAAVLILPAAAGGGNKISCMQAGPQAPRDITSKAGSSPITFTVAPPAADMNLCDIHFHKYAEHRASGYTELAGEGDHEGYICNGSKPALRPTEPEAHKDCRDIMAGDTVEVHWVFTTCGVKPGPTLASCFSATCKNPELRVEARVFHLTDDGSGADFTPFRTSTGGKVTLPEAFDPVEYLGSTTGSGYNDGSCSPFQVTWNVSSVCTPLEIASLRGWCGKEKNPFEEDGHHGVRHLVTDEALLSPIE